MGTQQYNNIDSNAPNEEEIIALLSRFLPTPSAGFYLRMKKTPWQIENFHKKEKLNYISLLNKRRIIWIPLVLFLLVILGISLIPSVQAIARQIIFSFLPAPSDKIDLKVSLSNPGDLFHFADPGNFPFTIQEIKEQSGINVKQLIDLPGELTLVGSRFDSDYNTVTILYLGPDYKLFLTQRPIGKGKDVFSIGSTAQVNIIMINDNQGEFVVGGWKVISTQTIPGTKLPGDQISIDAVWDNNLPQNTLRWKDEVYLYEIRSIGSGSPSLADLISLANGLK